VSAVFKNSEEKFAAYRDVFGTAMGRDVLRDMLIDAQIAGSTFNPDSSHVTAFNEGRRAFALSIASHAGHSIQSISAVVVTPVEKPKPKPKPQSKKRS
jgi:hypothetical protein